MTDDQFIEDFESGRLTAEEFDHAAHIRAAVCYLSRHPFLEACIAMRDGLQSFARRIGKPGLYHETITIAFMSLVSERMGRNAGLSWADFTARNLDLLDKNLLARYYRPETLASPLSRSRFLLSDVAFISSDQASAA
jgi:hypothetical protein